MNGEGARDFGKEKNARGPVVAPAPALPSEVKAVRVDEGDEIDVDVTERGDARKRLPQHHYIEARSVHERDVLLRSIREDFTKQCIDVEDGAAPRPSRRRAEQTRALGGAGHSSVQVPFGGIAGGALDPTAKTRRYILIGQVGEGVEVVGRCTEEGSECLGVRGDVGAEVRCARLRNAEKKGEVSQLTL